MTDYRLTTTTEDLFFHTSTAAIKALISKMDRYHVTSDFQDRALDALEGDGYIIEIDHLNDEILLQEGHIGYIINEGDETYPIKLPDVVHRLHLMDPDNLAKNLERFERLGTLILCPDPLITLTRTFEPFHKATT